jgi:hypothetical protein
MGKKIFFSVVVGALLVLGIEGACLAGIEPSPWQPEINKLHSIELQLAAINKRLAKVNEFETLPAGTAEYLNAMANQMQGLKAKLDEVLYVLPSPTSEGAYIGQDEAVLSLDSIRIDSKAGFFIIEDIVSRMGIEPMPFLPLFRDISINIIGGINLHIPITILPPLDPPTLPQLPN